MSPSSPEKYQVPSVESACRILRAVCEAEQPITLAQLKQAAGTSRTTMMRIVTSLCNNGFLWRGENGKIEAGEVMRALGSRMHHEADLRQRAVPVLRELAGMVGETAHLAIPLETHCLLQEVVDSPQIVRVASQAGTLIDYHCSGTGKSILAFRDDLLAAFRPNATLAARTTNTITQWDAFESELDAVRKQGYALDEQEYHIGVRCVGAPVWDSSGSVVAAIGVTGATTHLTKKNLPMVIRHVLAAAKQLSNH